MLYKTYNKKKKAINKIIMHRQTRLVVKYLVSFYKLAAHVL